LAFTAQHERVTAGTETDWTYTWEVFRPFSDRQQFTGSHVALIQSILGESEHTINTSITDHL